jgi:hypothetical protein
MLGGQWKIPCLVVNGRFHAWWLMEDPMLGGQWKIPCLVVNGRSHVWWSMEDPMLGGPWNVKENTFSSLPIPPNNFTLNLHFFSFGLMILLYHGPKPLLMPFFPLLRSINYDCAR